MTPKQAQAFLKSLRELEEHFELQFELKKQRSDYFKSDLAKASQEIISRIADAFEAALQVEEFDDASGNENYT